MSWILLHNSQVYSIDDSQSPVIVLLYRNILEFIWERLSNIPPNSPLSSGDGAYDTIDYSSNTLLLALGHDTLLQFFLTCVAVLSLSLMQASSTHSLNTADPQVSV